MSAEVAIWAAAASSITAMVAVVGLFFTWARIRQSELRTDDVLRWSNAVIAELQGIWLVCSSGEGQDDQLKSRLSSISINTSILIEQGRLFFANEVVDEWGEGKPAAYRGYRPSILDPIVVGHQIASAWSDASGEDRLRMELIAEDCVKKFVSLAQKEVGRSRTASSDTRRGGDGLHLRHLIDSVDPMRLAELKRRPTQVGVGVIRSTVR